MSDQAGESVSASLVARGYPESRVIMPMLQDFVALHQRKLSHVVAQYLAARCLRRNIPLDQAIDYREEYVMFDVCYCGGNDVNPASMFQIVDANFQSASDMPPNERKHFDKYM